MDTQNKIKQTLTTPIRTTEVELNPPPYHNDKSPIKIGIVHVKEDNPPENVESVEWFLLTTLDVQSVKTAINCVKWYCLRWRIEDWHRVLN